MARKKQIDLQKFRKAVATLKKKGLIQNIDARTAQPYYVRKIDGKTERLDKAVEKLDDVLSGKVQPVKLPPGKVREYKKAGYETTKEHVMVPVSATEKVKITTDKEIEIVDKERKISTIQKAVPFHNLRQWASDMRKKHSRINAMKAKNEYFAFRIEGHRSKQVFQTIGQLIDYIERYAAFDSSRKNQSAFYEGLEIIRLTNRDKWLREVDRKSMLSKSKQRSQSKAERAAWQRRFRAGLSGKQLQAYKRAARERAKKSREAKKATKFKLK